MNKEVRSMLETMYTAFREHAQDALTAWDRFIEFIAADHRPKLFYQLNHKFEWLFEDSKLVERIEQTYNPSLLQSDYYDHLGEMYVEQVLGTTGGKAGRVYLTPDEVNQEMAYQVANQSGQPPYVLDLQAQTGRLLMAVHKFDPRARLYGIEPDIRLLRIARTNLIIHGITACLLNADSHKHELDVHYEAGRFNWKHCNSWYSCLDKLKPITRSPLKPKNNGRK
ncbi:MAG: N-6 DNA methylase [Cyanobacteriota bacterium]